jgi:ADP-heptose:LPS heptosyltransferase
MRVAETAGLPSDAVLAELAALVMRAALVVTADTGVAHLSYAYATPSVVLFGPVPDGGRPPADHTSPCPRTRADSVTRSPTRRIRRCSV